MRKSIILLLAITSIISAQNKTFTLEESLQTGIINSKQLKISKAELIGSEGKVTELNSHILPKLSLNASYTRLSDIKPFEVFIPFMNQTLSIQEPVLNNYALKLSVRQPLFTGFRLTSIRDAAEYKSKATETIYKKEINEEAFNIHFAFWNFYKAQKVLKLIEENLKTIELHLKDTRNFLENGLVTKNDLLKLEVEYSNTKVNKLEAANNLEIARAAFNKAIGIELSASTKIVADDPKAQQLTDSFRELLQRALVNREELKSAKFNIKAGEENIYAARSGMFPSVYLFGNFYYSNPNQRIMPLEEEFNDTWDAGVTLQWDLWNWGGTSAQITQAEQRLVQAETSLTMMKENIEMEVYSNYLKTVNEYDKVQLQLKTVEQAEENYRIMTEKYKYQLATSTDLIDSEIVLLKAKTNLTNALVDLKLAEVRLNKSIGKRIY